MSTPICDGCGRFCRVADQYTNFGSCDMEEPPDPEVFCAKCSKEFEDELVAKTKRPGRIFLPWRPARFHKRAIKRLGMVLARPQHTAWYEAFWPDAVPADYIVLENKP